MAPRFARLAALLALAPAALVGAAPAPAHQHPAADPCAKIAGLTYVPPADALACMKSSPFNETLRQNVLTAVSRVFDFYTFEDYYLDSPPPFQESTINIRAQLARMNSTKYEVSAFRIMVGVLKGLRRLATCRRITTSTMTSTPGRTN